METFVNSIPYFYQHRIFDILRTIFPTKYTGRIVHSCLVLKFNLSDFSDLIVFLQVSPYLDRLIARL